MLLLRLCVLALLSSFATFLTVAQGAGKDPENGGPPVQKEESAPAKAGETKEKAPEPKPGLPDPEEVAAAMKKAAAWFRREASFAGGYPFGWNPDRTEAYVEGRKSPSVISIQPPATTTVGKVLVEAWRVTQDPLYLQAAREAAQCLTWCQLSTGGWPSDFDFNPTVASRYHFRRDLDAGETEPGKLRNRTTLDDNKTQSALLFLVHLAAEDPDNAELQRTVKFGFDGLLAAQAPNGGWPQQYSGPADPSLPADLKARYPEEWSRIWPNEDYPVYYTLNDGNILQAVLLLLEAYKVSGEERYLESAKKAGDFLILAQMPDPQPGWAQQYNFQMEPVWARKFEPPSVSSVESLASLRALHYLWVATGEERFLKPIPKALEWLRSCKLPDGQWARFYELRTNQPLYFVKDTYELTYDDGNMPTHYGFKIEDFGKSLERFAEYLELSREEMQYKLAEPDSEKRWASKAKSAAKKARSAMEKLDSKGAWKSDGGAIESRDFIENMNAMISYVKAARNGGEIFHKAWKESQPPPPPAAPEEPESGKKKPDNAAEKAGKEKASAQKDSQ